VERQSLPTDESAVDSSFGDKEIAEIKSNDVNEPELITTV
jgi:hypothetical protein